MKETLRGSAQQFAKRYSGLRYEHFLHTSRNDNSQSCTDASAHCACTELQKEKARDFKIHIVKYLESLLLSQQRVGLYLLNVHH